METFLKGTRQEKMCTYVNQIRATCSIYPEAYTNMMIIEFAKTWLTDRNKLCVLFIELAKTALKRGQPETTLFWLIESKHAIQGHARCNL